jgi:hypothetical protein
MRRTLIFLAFLSFAGVCTVSAQTVYMNLSEPQPLNELGIPFAQDDFFFANYSGNTVAVYVNDKEVGTVPAHSYRRAVFYVASKTKVEAYTNVLTDKGTKRVKMKRQALVIRKKDGTTDSGWMFYN